MKKGERKYMCIRIYTYMYICNTLRSPPCHPGRVDCVVSTMGDGNRRREFLPLSFLGTTAYLVTSPRYNLFPRGAGAIFFRGRDHQIYSLVRPYEVKFSLLQTYHYNIRDTGSAYGQLSARYSPSKRDDFWQ